MDASDHPTIKENGPRETTRKVRPSNATHATKGKERKEGKEGMLGKEARYYIVSYGQKEAASLTFCSSSSRNSYSRGATTSIAEASLPLPPRLHGKRSIFGKGRASSPSSLASSSSRTAIEGDQDYPLRRNARKNPNYPPSQPKPSARRSSSSKSHHQKTQADANFLFSEETISKDTRTTVMIKNIPNKYSQKLLLNMLDNHCIHCNEQVAEGEEEDEPLSALKGYRSLCTPPPKRGWLV